METSRRPIAQQEAWMQCVQGGVWPHLLLQVGVLHGFALPDAARRLAVDLLAAPLLRLLRHRLLLGLVQAQAGGVVLVAAGLLLLVSLLQTGLVARRRVGRLQQMAASQALKQMSLLFWVLLLPLLGAFLLLFVPSWDIKRIRGKANRTHSKLQGWARHETTNHSKGSTILGRSKPFCSCDVSALASRLAINLSITEGQCRVWIWTRMKQGSAARWHADAEQDCPTPCLCWCNCSRNHASIRC